MKDDLTGRMALFQDLSVSDLPLYARRTPMRTSLFGLVLLLGLPLLTSAQETVSRKDYEKTVRRLHDAQQDRFGLRAELSDTRLQQLAMVVHFTSQEKSSLLLDS